MSDFNCYNYFYVADLPSFIEMPEASIEAASCNSPSLYARTFFLEPRCEMVNTTCAFEHLEFLLTERMWRSLILLHPGIFISISQSIDCPAEL